MKNSDGLLKIKRLGILFVDKMGSKVCMKVLGFETMTV